MKVLKSLLHLQFFLSNVIIKVILSKSEVLHQTITENFQPSILPHPKEDGNYHRMLQQFYPRPIKILFDDSNIVSANKIYKDFVMNKIAPVVQEFFRLRLAVLSLSIPIKMNSNICYEVRYILRNI